MINEDFIDFLTSKETLSKFRTTEKGRKFRKATPIQIAAVILCVLKNKQDGKYYYGDRVNAVLTHRVVHKLLCTPNKYKETDIELYGKDANLTEDTIYSILRSFKFFDPNKTKERYSFRDGYFYTDERGKHYNNWRIKENKLCEYIGWDSSIYDDVNIEDTIVQIDKKMDEVLTKIDEVKKDTETILYFEVDDNDVHKKAIEVLNALKKADNTQLSDWIDYFSSVIKCNSVRRVTKERAQSALNSIYEYIGNKI